MYKVFYNDRSIFLIDDFIKTFQDHHGLFYKYVNKKQLLYLLKYFPEVKGIEHLYIYHENKDKLLDKFSEAFRYIEAAGGVVITPERKVLIMKRRGVWDLPKGKIDKGESSETAAVRETMEECGIERPKIEKLITSTYHIYHLKSKLHLKKTDWYLMKHSGASDLHPQAEEDITEVLWQNPENLHEFVSNTYPSIIEVLKKARII